MKFRYATLVARILGRELQPTDSVDSSRLTDAERRLGFALPEVVADFYLLAGAAPELQAHNRLRQPDALEVEDGYLVFMEENQNVVNWGMALPLSPSADPEVWQCSNGDEPQWYSEGMTFSVFIVRNLAFVQGFELSDCDL